MQNGTRLAAVDLGSNSFRLEIGRYDQGQIHPSEYLKETVRQGNGLDAERNLTPEAMQRGWDCLARFGERLAGFNKAQVRAVATQTLREARNRDVFIAQATRILGFPIDVIAGREEARLIYQGVVHKLPQSDEQRLVIDIGGRSTELILGQGFEASVTESYRVGSVAWSMKYFPAGELTAEAFSHAQVAATAVLDEALQLLQPGSWQQVYGASGTVGAVGDILAAEGRSNDSATGLPVTITRDGLDWLLDKLLRAQHISRVKLEGMKEDRRGVIGGGVSILRALFDLLGIDQMQMAAGALRHGVLYDMLGRENAQTDLRSASVQRLARSFAIDTAQAQRVGAVASRLFVQSSAASDPTSTQRHLTKLQWAAQLHEIGGIISHSDHHKHGAYILDHCDAPGFAVHELHRLGLLVLGHRGKLRKLEAELGDAVFVQQLLCLRLAVLLCHARRDPDCAALQLHHDTRQNRFTLHCPSAWAQRYPQSAHLLREESLAWQKTAWGFVLDTNPSFRA